MNDEFSFNCLSTFSSTICLVTSHIAAWKSGNTVNCVDSKCSARKNLRVNILTASAYYECFKHLPEHFFSLQYVGTAVVFLLIFAGICSILIGPASEVNIILIIAVDGRFNMTASDWNKHNLFSRFLFKT